MQEIQGMKSPREKMRRELEETRRGDRRTAGLTRVEKRARVRLRCSGSPRAEVTIRGVTLLIKVGLPASPSHLRGAARGNKVLH